MSEIPVGYCQCGCGRKTNLAKTTNKKYGFVKGQPVRFVLGHRKRDLPTVEPNPSGVCMCGCGLPAPIAYKNLTRLGWMKGKPARYIHGHNSGSGADRVKEFMRLANKTDDDSCWIWGGRKDYDGYGVFRGFNRTVRAHRFSYELFNGEIEKGMEIRHKCDNPPCVNPNHLIQGTRLDNARDMRERGRSLAGEKHPFAKLTENDVIEIRKIGRCSVSEAKEIGKRYGVGHQAILAIISKRNWKHIP